MILQMLIFTAHSAVPTPDTKHQQQVSVEEMRALCETYKQAEGPYMRSVDTYLKQHLNAQKPIKRSGESVAPGDVVLRLSSSTYLFVQTSPSQQEYFLFDHSPREWISIFKQNYPALYQEVLQHQQKQQIPQVPQPQQHAPVKQQQFVRLDQALPLGVCSLPSEIPMFQNRMRHGGSSEPLPLLDIDTPAGKKPVFIQTGPYEGCTLDELPSLLQIDWTQYPVAPRSPQSFTPGRFFLNAGTMQELYQFFLYWKENNMGWIWANKEYAKVIQKGLSALVIAHAVIEDIKTKGYDQTTKTIGTEPAGWQSLVENNSVLVQQAAEGKIRLQSISEDLYIPTIFVDEEAIERMWMLFQACIEQKKRSLQEATLRSRKALLSSDSD